MQPTIVSETPMTLAELKEGIARIRKRDPEPSFRVVRTEEYVTSFVEIGSNQAATLFDKLMKLNVPRMRDVHVCKIIDLMPANVNDLKLMLQGYSITVSNDNLKKIIDVLAEYQK